jgi:hypothetical protein
MMPGNLIRLEVFVCGDSCKCVFLATCRSGRWGKCAFLGAFFCGKSLWDVLGVVSVLTTKHALG